MNGLTMIQLNYKSICYLKPEEIQQGNVSGLDVTKLGFKDLFIVRYMHTKKWGLESSANFIYEG
ncbi:hypothetical protein D3C87_1698180 [compost metagenome]